MPSINPYLNFAGNTEEAFKFYQSILGGELNIMRFSDTPQAENVPPAIKDKVMHASLPIGKGNHLMATDACEEMGFNLKQGNNYYLCFSPDSRDDATRIFNALAEGGKINMLTHCLKLFLICSAPCQSISKITSWPCFNCCSTQARDVPYS